MIKWKVSVWMRLADEISKYKSFTLRHGQRDITVNNVNMEGAF